MDQSRKTDQSARPPVASHINSLVSSNFPTSTPTSHNQTRLPLHFLKLRPSSPSPPRPLRRPGRDLHRTYPSSPPGVSRLTCLVLRCQVSSVPAEEAFVQQLEQLQSGLVNLGARAAGVQQGDVNHGRVVVARVLPAAEREEMGVSGRTGTPSRGRGQWSHGYSLQGKEVSDRTGTPSREREGMEDAWYSPWGEKEEGGLKAV